jgi:hypothetical protein
MSYELVVVDSNDESIKKSDKSAYSYFTELVGLRIKDGFIPFGGVSVSAYVLDGKVEKVFSQAFYDEPDFEDED